MLRHAPDDIITARFVRDTLAAASVSSVAWKLASAAAEGTSVAETATSSNITVHVFAIVHRCASKPLERNNVKQSSSRRQPPTERTSAATAASASMLDSKGDSTRALQHVSNAGSAAATRACRFASGVREGSTKEDNAIDRDCGLPSVLGPGNAASFCDSVISSAAASAATWRRRAGD